MLLNMINYHRFKLKSKDNADDWCLAFISQLIDISYNFAIFRDCKKWTLLTGRCRVQPSSKKSFQLLNWVSKRRQNVRAIDCNGVAEWAINATAAVMILAGKAVNYQTFSRLFPLNKKCISFLVPNWSTHYK